MPITTEQLKAGFTDLNGVVRDPGGNIVARPMTPAPMVHDVRGDIVGPNFGLKDALIRGAVGFVTGGPAGAAAGALSGLTSGGGPSDSPFPSSGLDTSKCPPGRIRVGSQCVDPRAALPGGAPLTVPASAADAGGETTIGAMGIPAMIPELVGVVRDSNGNANPIRRCRTGMVLGKDDLCYVKGSIPSRWRKWKPAPKPPMTAADAKALRRIGTLQKKVKKLASNAGLSTKRR